jgi:hypothetical protein
VRLKHHVPHPPITLPTAVSNQPGFDLDGMISETNSVLGRIRIIHAQDMLWFDAPPCSGHVMV